MHDRGFSLVEMMVVVLVIMILGAVAAPNLKAYSQEAHLMGAANLFRGEFQRARSICTRTNRQLAIRFEAAPAGDTFSLYADGNHNGVRAADIRTGVDERLGGPYPLSSRAEGVRIGINPRTPAIPPETGLLDTDDPIRFANDMVSFSPVGTATPGTFYLAGEHLQAAVRVVAGTARVRLLIYRNRRWVER